MALDVKMRQIELTYNWDSINNTHMLTWDTDYPMNIHGTCIKVFKPTHAYDINDKIRLIGSELDADDFTFINLNGIPARSNCFVPGQYVPICIDFDDKTIAYFAPRAGSTVGETIIQDIRVSDWVNKQFLVRVADMSDEMVVVMSPKEGATKNELKSLVSYGITADIVPQGIMVTSTLMPITDITIHFTIL